MVDKIGISCALAAGPQSTPQSTFGPQLRRGLGEDAIKSLAPTLVQAPEHRN